MTKTSRDFESAASGVSHGASPPPVPIQPERTNAGLLAGLGFFLVAVVSLTPLVLEPRPVEFLPSWAGPWSWIAKIVTILLLGCAIVIGSPYPRGAAEWRRIARRALLAALLTACHFQMVDSEEIPAAWQRDIYLGILNHTADAPHQFRPLPYGFVRSLERFTGDWGFACAAYRWFFTYWFLWACWRFARRYQTEGGATWTVIVVALLYPASIAFYWGQLTDPLSHALFVLALVYIVENRGAPLAAALALGVLAKETMVLIVPTYLVCNWKRGRLVLAKTALLAAVSVLAFLAVRLPLGWRPGYQQINGTEELMVAANLGLPGAHYQGAAPVYQNYLQPLLFIGIFLPFVFGRWESIDPRLRLLFLTLTPLLLLSNLCFGWMYESRNYMPLVPLLAVMAWGPSLRPGGGLAVPAMLAQPGE